ncbi:hypothetical protein FG95_01533 [Sphingopyxis sp. LC363]|nr:hypothetical protein FG95_01533 [Sphingopyxis sp. LC363]
MRPALISVARSPAVKATIPPCWPPPKIVLDASSSKRPVPVPASPSVSKPSNVSSLSFVAWIFSQPSKRATPSVVTLSKTSASLPTPPVIRGEPPRLALVRLASRALSSSPPRSTVPWTTPPPSQTRLSVPTLISTSPPTDPPVIVMLSVPPDTLILPPIVPPERMIVSLPKPATRLRSMIPPDMSKRLSASFILTRPIRPPVIRAVSPSSKASTMRPPVIWNVSIEPP